MKNTLSLIFNKGLDFFWIIEKMFLNLFARKEPVHQEKFVPNPEKIYSVDTFGYSQKKWGWLYGWDLDRKQYLVKCVLPFCPRCDNPMEHNGNPFLEASCPNCKELLRRSYSHKVFQFQHSITAEIQKRYHPETLIPVNLPEVCSPLNLEPVQTKQVSAHGLP